MNRHTPVDRPGGANAADKEQQRAARAREARKSEQDRKLHETLKDTFPASDPPSTGQATGREKPKSRIDRKPARLPPLIPKAKP